jgi:CRP-like cAMP-binding protein
MFVVFSGKVSLDFGVDSSLVRTYGIGALVGLPATITRRNYSMTATVTEDAELGFGVLRRWIRYCVPVPISAIS